MPRTPALVLALLLAATAAQADAPASTGELAKRIKSYQASRDCGGMTGLFYTQGMDEARKKSFTHTVQGVVCGAFDRKITSVAFQEMSPGTIHPPADFGGHHSVYTLAPEGAVVIDYDAAKPTDAKSMTFLYGSIDGKVYLLTSRNADTK